MKPSLYDCVTGLGLFRGLIRQEPLPDLSE